MVVVLVLGPEKKKILHPDLRHSTISTSREPRRSRLTGPTYMKGHMRLRLLLVEKTNPPRLAAAVVVVAGPSRGLRPLKRFPTHFLR